jgi:hypothetical protein
MIDPEGFVEKADDTLGVVSVGWKAISNDSKSSSRIRVERPAWRDNPRINTIWIDPSGILACQK